MRYVMRAVRVGKGKRIHLVDPWWAQRSLSEGWRVTLACGRKGIATEDLGLVRPHDPLDERYCGGCREARYG